MSNKCDSPIMVDVEQPRDNPKPSDSVFDAFPVFQPEYILDPEDGLARPADPPYSPEEAYSPPLSPDTLICMKQPERDGYPAVEKCVHYRRQLVQDEDIDRMIIQRWCTQPQLRGLNGAALCLRDTALPHCELREPPDPRSTDMMDKIDEQKIRLGADRKLHRVFKTVEDLKAGRTRDEG